MARLIPRVVLVAVIAGAAFVAGNRIGDDGDAATREQGQRLDESEWLNEYIAVDEMVRAAYVDGAFDPSKIDHAKLDALAKAIDGHEDVPVYTLLRDIVWGTRLAVIDHEPRWMPAVLTTSQAVQASTGIELEVAKRLRAIDKPFRPLTESAGATTPVPTGPPDAGELPFVGQPIPTDATVTTGP